MLSKLKSVALGVALLSSCSFTSAFSPADIPTDLPVSQLVSTANTKLAAGNTQEALTYFDVAISKDPQNYLTIFKRGATYLSLGRNIQAKQDFDKVLAIKPGFEGALLQRAKIKSRNGEWAAARKDYEAAGKAGGPEIAELEEAQRAAIVAMDMAGRGDWENCVTQASVAIAIAGLDVELRKLRADCRFERGEIMEGVNDLQLVVQISSGSTDPHMKISAMTFYSLGETEKGLAQIRQCLHSDPDSRPCMKLMKQEKYIIRQLQKVKELAENKKFASAVKLLVKQKDDDGLIYEIKDEVKRLKENGLIHANAPHSLYDSVIETTCDAYVSMNNKKRGAPYCKEALQANPAFLNGLIIKAESQLENEDYEGAIKTLNDAKEHHPRDAKIAEMLNKAHLKLRISKQKDYYKVLGVVRDADDREIKRAYRKLTMQYHPDKASQNGLDKEEAEKKMAELNEAYEVLSDPDLRARFDNGDDPNNPENQGSPFQGSPFGAGGQQFFFNPGGQGNPFGGSFKFHHQGGFPGGGFPF